MSTPKPRIRPKAEPCRQWSGPPMRDAPSHPERDLPPFTERDSDARHEAEERVIFQEDDCLR